ncbi:MAG: MoaD/ThiS family protein [Longimicrobiaceae bacterium]
MTTVKITLPVHLRTLAQVEDELAVEIDPPTTVNRVLDVLERSYPMLRGTIRDHATGERRAYIRFFACGHDLSHDQPDTPLPDAVATGAEVFYVIGAIAGG